MKDEYQYEELMKLLRILKEQSERTNELLQYVVSELEELNKKKRSF